MRSEEELKHFGILGMKWGVRRYQPYPKGEGHKGIFKGKNSKSTPKNNSLEREKARNEKKAKASARSTKRENAKTERQNNRAIRREQNKKTKTVDDPKKVKKLSDEELKQVVQRLQMEKRYVELTTPTKSKGQKLIENFIAETAQKTAKAYVDEWLKEKEKKSTGGTV